MKSILRIFLPLLAISLLASSSRPLEHGYKIGDFAEDFQLKDTEGNMVSLGMIRYSSAKGFIIVFTCNHCPFSKKYEDRIIALSKKYEPLGYPLIAINPNDVEREPEDSYENMQKLARQKSYPFPYLHDEPQRTTFFFGAEKTPHVYVLKKESGKYKVSYIGAIDDDVQNTKEKKQKYVENAVDELLAGKAVSVSETKAVGCGIKWKQ
jgi:glutathione peroxidase-family protein